LAALAAAALLPLRVAAQGQRDSRPRAVERAPGAPDSRSGRPRLSVSVHEPGGAHLEKASRVTVRRGDEASIELQRIGRKLTYEANIEPGTYRLHVDAPGWADVDYDVVIGLDDLAIPVYLGMPGWPWYRMGRSIVPFDPHDDRVAVAFVRKPPSKKQLDALLARIGDLGLRPYPTIEKFLVADRSIAYFQTKDPGVRIFADDGAADVIDKLAALFEKDSVRIGLPIDDRPGQIKILDNQYVVAFAKPDSPDRIRRFAESQGAVAEPVQGLVNTWRFQFNNRSNYRDHLRKVEAIRTQTDLEVLYAEPNLIFQVSNHQCTDSAVGSSCSAAPPSKPTDDPWSKCQTNLLLQSVPDAWCYLEQKLGASSKFGSDDVCVATVDCGINEQHPDLPAGKVEYISLCDTCLRSPNDTHGIAVLGIISALPNNKKGISGIAPGVHHVAIQMQTHWLDSTWYSQMITWLSGVDPLTGVFPPLARPADIISCSHGSGTMPTPSTVEQAFNRVTNEGRKDLISGQALGTVLVYSAGNGDTDMTGTQALATGPHVIAVGNTLPADTLGVEVREPTSNKGDRLDLCAQGQLAPSLYFDPTRTVPGPRGSCQPGKPSAGAYRFKGTSAACPMVAATAALMLSINKQLTSQQIRDKLRDTAQCVDPVDGDWVGHRSYLYGSGRLDVHAAVKAADTSSA